MRYLRLLGLGLLSLPLTATSAHGDAPAVMSYSCTAEGCVGGDVKCGGEVIVWNTKTGTWYSVQCYTSIE